METGPKWYITRGEQRIGPLDASQLKHMAQTAKLGPTEYVWKEGMAQWVQAQQVQGLFDPPEPEPVVTQGLADVSPVIPAYAPPAQPEAMPLIGGGGAAAPAATTIQSAPTPDPAPAKSAEQIRSASTTDGAIQHRENPRPATQLATTTRPAVISIGTAGAAPKTTYLNALPSVSHTFDGWLPVLGGLLILATIGIPWFAGPEYPYGPVKVLFSWDFLKRAFAAGGPTSVGVWIVGSWVLALAAIIVTPIAKGTARAAIYTLLGAAAAVLLIVAYVKSDLGADPFKSGMSELEKPLGFVAGILTFAVFILTHLIRRSGPNAALRIIQIIATSALLIITAILLITAFAAARSIWSQYGGYQVKSPYTGLLRGALLVSNIGTIVASALLLLGAIMGGRRGFFSGAGLLLLYGITLLSLVGDIVLPAGALAAWGSIYAEVCGALIMLGTALILGAGLVLLIDHLRRASAPAAAAPARVASSPAGGSVEQKFARLEQLRKTGVISDTEYQQKRQELLRQI
jgi:hypothetical protein